MDSADLAPNPEPVITDQQWREDGKKAAEDFRSARIDSNRLLLDDSAGVKEIIHFDDAADTFTLERVQDVEGTLEWCKGRYNEGLVNRHCEFRHVARLPVTVVELFAKANLGPQAQWSDMLKRENEPLFDRMLNDPDLSLFRTLPGAV